MSNEDAPAPVAVGEVLDGKYQVERVLGVGGMGVVVAARHVHLGGRVALKFLLPHGRENAEATGRFLREARSATRITSEHVARVSDIGTLANGAPYMVMEHLDGRDLGQLLEAGPLRIGTVVDYLLQALEAIAEAHSLGIVHRDLKPSNLFLTRRADGSPLVKVLDFGIAKAMGDGDAAAPSLTRTTGMVGSPSYMAPEQIRSSRTVDGRADVWALGVVLFELLTGESPFVGESLPAVLAAIIADSPRPLRTLRPDAPAALEMVILQCLEKEPGARFANVSALAAAIAPFADAATDVSLSRIRGILGDTASQAHAPPTTRRLDAPRPSPARYVVGALVVGAAIVGGVLLAHRTAPPSVAVAPPAPSASTSVTAATSATPPAPSTVIAAPPDVEPSVAVVPSEPPAHTPAATAGPKRVRSTKTTIGNLIDDRQ